MVPLKASWAFTSLVRSKCLDLCKFKLIAAMRLSCKFEFIRSSGGTGGSRGVNLLLKGGDNRITALHDAVDNNHPEIARLLLQFGGKNIKHPLTNTHTEVILIFYFDCLTVVTIIWDWIALKMCLMGGTWRLTTGVTRLFKHWCQSERFLSEIIFYSLQLGARSNQTERWTKDFHSITIVVFIFEW